MENIFFVFDNIFVWINYLINLIIWNEVKNNNDVSFLFFTYKGDMEYMIKQASLSNSI